MIYMKKKTFFLFTILIFQFVGNIFSQDQDYYLSIWNNPKKSIEKRFLAIEDLIWNLYIFENPDSAFYFINQEFEEAKRINNLHYQALALNTKASCYYINEDFKNAITYYNKSLKLYEANKDIKGQSTIYNNLGNIYKEYGDFVKAINLYMKSLKIDEKLNNYKGQAIALNNIGILYADLDEFDKSIEYYKKSIRINKKLKNFKGLASPLNNIGNVYESQKKYDKAKIYYIKSMEIDKSNNNISGVATSLLNVANIEKSQGDITNDINERKILYDKAEKKCIQIIEMVKNFQDNSLSSNTYLLLGNIFEKKNDLKKAKLYGEKALAITLKTGAIEPSRDVASFLYEIYSKENDLIHALKMHELYVKMADSLRSINNQDEVIRQEYKYFYEKQSAADSVVKAKEKEIVNAKFEHEKTQRFALYGGLALLLLFALFILNRYRVTFQQKEIISQKEQETSKQKHLLELKNREITDSINYAKRIQAAILPPAKIVKEYLKDSFILYIPRDIVAGDFYWMEQTENGLIFAAADCTGHGVPGAMVSVLCNNALNRSVREYKLIDPAAILNVTREIIIAEFDKAESEVNDGMDVSICTLQDNGNKGKKLLWAGANSPLWIVRNKQLIEFSPNKQPIGKYEFAESFKQHEIELQEGDCIYLSTDGFKDQFGGNKLFGKDKKLKSTLMKSFLCEISELEMDVQQKKLNDFFYEWKGENEQVDDVCVIGVKV